MSDSIITGRRLDQLHSGKNSDIIIKVTKGDQTREFKCHKIILQTKSGVLTRLMQEGNEIELKTSVDPDTFYSLLYYIYTDQIKTAPVDKLQDLFRCAKELNVVQYKNLYKKELKCNMFFLLHNWEYSRHIRDKEREKYCEDLIKNRTRSALNKCIIDNLNPDTVMWLLDQEYLKLVTDMKLVSFLAKYRDVNKVSDEFIDEAKKKIRFLNIKQTNLIAMNEKFHILNENELSYIRKNVEKPESEWEMPDGYSTDRRRRADYVEEQKTTADEATADETATAEAT